MLPPSPSPPTHPPHMTANMESLVLCLLTSSLVFYLKVNAFPITVMFGMCSIFLLVASILQRRLLVIAEKQSKSFPSTLQLLLNLDINAVLSSSLDYIVHTA